MSRSARWTPVVVTTAVAAVLACAAIATAHHAACDDPGSYVLAPGGVQLVGGCLRSDDLPVPPAPHEQPAPPPAAPVGD